MRQRVWARPSSAGRARWQAVASVNAHQPLPPKRQPQEPSLRQAPPCACILDLAAPPSLGKRLRCSQATGEEMCTPGRARPPDTATNEMVAASANIAPTPRTRRPQSRPSPPPHAVPRHRAATRTWPFAIFGRLQATTMMLLYHTVSLARPWVAAIALRDAYGSIDTPLRVVLHWPARTRAALRSGPSVHLHPHSTQILLTC